MSYLVNTVKSFTSEMAEGFVRAHADEVRRVPGGVARIAATPPGEVALVIGGGSGHFPAFAGMVGDGLAHAAALGEVFASPSAQQIYSVAKSVASDAGVLFCYGNYTGDVLNFDLAQQRLSAEGVPVRTVVVTDDISSAPAGESRLRRGVAGDLMVFRAAGWACAQGMSLNEVWSLADRANRRTRTLGIAFSGCTLPGADAPLFTVPPGTMAVGMGIHGEPGIEQLPLGSADEIARLLVDRVLEESPRDAGNRVAPLLNGLGSVKHEELYVLYRAVSAQLEKADLVTVCPDVGEFATSFEMAGVSLSLMWLDEELEQSWCAPVSAPGYRRGARSPGSSGSQTAARIRRRASAPGSPGSRAAAAVLVDAVRVAQQTIDKSVGELGRIDAVAGDGDHGLGMQRGAAAAAEACAAAAAQAAGAGTALFAAGDAWSDKAGGTSGALWGRCLSAAARVLGDQQPVDLEKVVEAVWAGVDAVAQAGRAQPGDKTMLDAMRPFAEQLREAAESGLAPEAAWRHAARAAQQAADATAGMVPRRGRARAHSTNSLGTPDAGAVSFALMVNAVAQFLDTAETRTEK